ncbi:MAG: tail fiber domain-containing protein [Fluviicola sp.]
MKKIRLSTKMVAIFVSIIDVGFAQQFPTGTPPGGTTAAQANAGWYRGGNNNSNGSNNVFGTLWNSPIYTATNNILRQKLNGNVTYSIAGSNQPRNGYQLIGANGPMFVGGANELYTNFGAFSLLHLNGNNGTFTQQFGHRDWMRTGITFTDNDDMSYFGLRKVGTGTDITETAVVWADNSGSSGGPDDFVFRFTSGNNSVATLTDLAVDSDADGLHIGRFAGTGQFGLGNTFGAIPTIAQYIRPQSLFHMSYQFRTGAAAQGFGFQQITYRRPFGAGADIIGQGEAATDGLRFGIDNQVMTGNPQNYLNSYLRWQEASNFIIQTEDDNIPNIGANERLRVTSIGAMMLTQSPPLGYDGLTTATNATRISISESGSLPLERPKSLLHLGYDYGGFFTVQGYRKWMDLGMLTSNNRDHVWIGLKPRDSIVTTVSAINDRLDAVVAWGTDRQATVPTAVDNMRFIFTGHVLDANPDRAPSTSYNGLEMMRLYPATKYSHPIYDASGAQIDSTLAYGRVGIGDFTVSGVNQEPTHKLDVVGNGRFRYLPDSTYIADSLVTKVVMVDDHGVLRWKSFVPSEFGTYCADSVNGKLDADKKVVLNNHNLYFTNHPDSMILDENRLGVGYVCGTNLPGKLATRQLHDQTVAFSTTAGHFYNSDTANAINLRFIGALGRADGKQPTGLRSWNIGGSFHAESADINVGVLSRAEAGFMSSSNNMAGNFTAMNGSVATGLVAQGSSGTNRSIGVSGVGSSPLNLSLVENIGGQFTGSYNTQLNYGVKAAAAGGNTAIGLYGIASGGLVNFAAYLDGDVYHGGLVSGPSDQMLKENVVTIENADSLLNLLNPVTFDFKTDDYPQLNLLTENQMGLIAQQVETVFPNIVSENHSPAVYDSVGTVIYPSVDFKTVDYTKLIPVLISGHKEQAAKIQAKDSIIDSLQNQVADLNDRLTQLENCLSGILPYLCQLSNSAIQANTPQSQEAIRSELSVRLSNRETIILDQNVPNPFAEQTVINFSIPESVQKAQIHFYDGQGKLMQSVDVKERGLGSLTVFGSDLSTGVYTYTLVADGQVVATKKMMKQ